MPRPSCSPPQTFPKSPPPDLVGELAKAIATHTHRESPARKRARYRVLAMVLSDLNGERIGQPVDPRMEAMVREAMRTETSERCGPRGSSFTPAAVSSAPGPTR